jgi:predicted nucleic acid-binding OB-fold protein
MPPPFLWFTGSFLCEEIVLRIHCLELILGIGSGTERLSVL